MRTNMVVMNIRKFFTELVNPLGYTRLGYIVFFGKATEGSALLKMKKVVVVGCYGNGRATTYAFPPLVV